MTSFFVLYLKCHICRQIRKESSISESLTIAMSFFKRPVLTVVLNENKIEYHGHEGMNAQLIPAIRDVDYFDFIFKLLI